MKRSTLAAGIAATLLGFTGLVTSAQAAIIGATPDADLLDSPFTFTFGDSDQASYTFSSDGPAGFGEEPISVSTGGSALVFATNFTGQPPAFSEGTLFDENPGLLLASPEAFPDGTTVGFTSGGGFVGLQFTLEDGIHFGYAEVDSFPSSTLLSFAFESEAGVGIRAGAPIDRPINVVPEPSTLALFSLGLVGLTFAARRRQNRL